MTKLNPTGTGLVYSTFLGGYAYAYATAIAVDSAGRAYIAGNENEYCDTFYDYQGCFPTTSGAVISGTETGGRSPQYAFVAAFDPTGAQLLYSTIFGDLNGFTCLSAAAARMAPGSRWMQTATSIWSARPRPATCRRPPASFSPPAVLWAAVEPMWRLGAASSPSSIRSLPPVEHRWPTPPTWAGTLEALGDYISGITIDSASNAYIVGYTNSPDFPVTAGAYSTVCGPNGQNCAAAHVTKLNPTATAILWSTFVGDAKADGSDALFFTGPIQLDGNGNVYIMGQPNPGFPYGQSR